MCLDGLMMFTEESTNGTLVIQMQFKVTEWGVGAFGVSRWILVGKFRLIIGDF